MLSVVDMFNKVHIFVSNNHVHGVFILIVQNNNTPHIPGADPGGGGRTRRAPLKLEKI